jgi:cytoskeletal protein RodZ
MQSKLKRSFPLLLKLVAICMLGLVIVTAYLITRPAPVFTPEPIPTPDAPETESVTASDFSITESSTEPTPVDTPIKTQDVSNIAFSPDSTQVLVMENSTEQSDTPDTTSELKVTLAQVIKNTKALKVLNKKTNVTKVIEKGGVVAARFIDNSNIYYQLTGNRGGIYKYDLDRNTKDLMFFSSNPQTIDNIYFLDSNKYFFIKPTGQIGFAFTNSDQVITLDNQPLKTSSSYVMENAYAFAGLSPDKQYITLLNKNNTSDDFGVELIILPVSSTQISDVYFQAQINLAPKNGKLSDVIRWSSDSKYLMAGDKLSLIDIAAKQVIYTYGNGAYIGRFLNTENIFICQDPNTDCFITNVSGTKNIKVAKLVGQAEWLSDNLVMIVIGDKLYNFNLAKNKLELISKVAASYQILTITLQQNAIVKQDNNLLQINAK